jgi:hypothetical protein
VRYYRSPQPAGALKQWFVGKPISAVLLCGQHIDLSNSQLTGNCMIDVNIQEKRYGHGASAAK